MHLNCDNGHPPATAIIIREADKKPEDCKLSIVFENPLTSKCWLVDVRLTEKPSSFLRECLNAMFHLRMCISNSLHQQLKKKKRHFDASFIYVIFPTHDWHNCTGRCWSMIGYARENCLFSGKDYFIQGTGLNSARRVYINSICCSRACDYTLQNNAKSFPM